MPVIQDPTPAFLKPENESVMDSPVTRAIRLLAQLLGADDPASQAFALAAPLEAPVAKGIKAYHGSPHTFDKFDMSKVGTGEGAQAYGHGLYFAERPGVANEYRNRLTADLPVDIEKFDPDLGYGVTDPKTGKIRWFSFEKEAKDFVRDNAGHTYEVRINASPDEFLDWDKPLSQQSEKVRSALSTVLPEAENAAFTTKSLLDGRVEILAPTGESMGKYAPNEVPEALENFRAGYMGRGLGARELTGGDVIERFKQLSPPSMSASLRRAGVPGIRYLDQGSRTAGQGTSNYVVFDDKIVDIIKMLAAAGALAPSVDSLRRDALLNQMGESKP